MVKLRMTPVVVPAEFTSIDAPEVAGPWVYREAIM
jgi:hypothetical protein